MEQCWTSINTGLAARQLRSAVVTLYAAIPVATTRLKIGAANYRTWTSIGSTWLII